MLTSDALPLVFLFIFIFETKPGETPAKRDYPTNVSLAATTPLDKIKQRFRKQINAMNSPNANYSFLND